jgi:hypothetical protein
MTPIGTHLDTAQRSDLFKWFHLERVGQARDQNGLDRVDFRPTGASFRPLVQLSTWLNAESRIVQLRLALARDFVNDPRQGAFARDIAKSFLRATSPRGEPPEFSDLVHEIEFGPAGKAAPVIMAASRALPPLPQTPSPGYRVYLGEAASHAIAWPGGLVEIEDAGEELLLAVR